MEALSGVTSVDQRCSKTSTRKTRHSMLKQNPSTSKKHDKNETAVVEICNSTHSSVQLHKCKVCRKAFLKLANLEKHEKIHQSQDNGAIDMTTKTKSNITAESQATTKSGTSPDCSVNKSEIQKFTTIKQKRCLDGEIEERGKAIIRAQEKLNGRKKKADSLQPVTGMKGCTSTEHQTASDTGRRALGSLFQVEQETVNHSETEQAVQKQVVQILDFLNSEDEIVGSDDQRDGQTDDGGSDDEKDGRTDELCGLISSAVKTEVSGGKAESTTLELKHINIAEKSQNIESGKDRRHNKRCRVRLTTLKEIRGNISESKHAGVKELFQNSRTTRNEKKAKDSTSAEMGSSKDWSDHDSDYTEEKVDNDDAVAAEPKHEESLESKPFFSCRICGEKFKNQTHMKSHRWKHFLHRRSTQGDERDEGQACNVCHKVMKSRGALIAHKKTHLKEDKCEECGKIFSSPSNLLKHKKTVHTENHFICEVCGAAYKASCHLNTHKLKAHDDKTYLCEECGKSFPHQSNLQKHIRTHAAIKSFVCDICGRGFTFSGPLHRHRRTHTDEKPFECVTCGKHFRTGYNLTVHVRVHTMEKPFKCYLCPEAFNHNVSLKTHIKKNHT